MSPWPCDSWSFSSMAQGSAATRPPSEALRSPWGTHCKMGHTWTCSAQPLRTPEYSRCSTERCTERHASAFGRASLDWATTGWQRQSPGKHFPAFADRLPFLLLPFCSFRYFFFLGIFCSTTSRRDKDLHLLIEFVFHQENHQCSNTHRAEQSQGTACSHPTLIPCWFPQHSPVPRMPPANRQHKAQWKGAACTAVGWGSR